MNVYGNLNQKGRMVNVLVVVLFGIVIVKEVIQDHAIQINIPVGASAPGAIEDKGGRAQ